MSSSRSSIRWKTPLKGTAIATQAAYDQNAGSYLQAENGDIWKGSYNISQSETLVDTIKKESGMDVTFFYGTERIMTSALDKNGDRILGSPAGDVVAEKVLKKAKAISATIFPWMARSITAITLRSIRRMILSAPIGMVFAGIEKQPTYHSILNILNTIIVIVIIAIVFCTIIVQVSATSMTRALNRSIACVKRGIRG